LLLAILAHLKPKDLHGFLQFLLSLFTGLLGGLEILEWLLRSFAGLLGLLDGFADLTLKSGLDGFTQGFTVFSNLLEGESVKSVVEGVLKIVVGLFKASCRRPAFGNLAGLLGRFGEVALLGSLPSVLERLGLCTLLLAGLLASLLILLLALSRLRLTGLLALLRLLALLC